MSFSPQRTWDSKTGRSELEFQRWGNITERKIAMRWPHLAWPHRNRHAHLTTPASIRDEHRQQYHPGDHHLEVEVKEKLQPRNRHKKTCCLASVLRHSQNKMQIVLFGAHGWRQIDQNLVQTCRSNKRSPLAKTQSDSSGLLMKYSTFLSIRGKLAEQSGGKTMKTKTVKLDAIKARGATVSNLGVLKHPATKPSRGELRRSLAMRKMYARSRPSTAPADVSRIRRLESTFSAIQRDGAQVPRKGEHTPVYDTRHLIVSKFPKPSPLDYVPRKQFVERI